MNRFWQWKISCILISVMLLCGCAHKKEEIPEFGGSYNAKKVDEKKEDSEQKEDAEQNDDISEKNF